MQDVISPILQRFRDALTAAQSVVVKKVKSLYQQDLRLLRAIHRRS